MLGSLSPALPPCAARVDCGHHLPSIFAPTPSRTQFVYLREAFAPALDDDMDVLAKSYGIGGTLYVNYALTPAWG